MRISCVFCEKACFSVLFCALSCCFCYGIEWDYEGVAERGGFDSRAITGVASVFMQILRGFLVLCSAYYIGRE